jgi:enoyl-CoA hydratase/carnithine racemase
MSGDVLVEFHPEGVALVTLNRPERLNAVTIASGRELLRTLRDLDADPAVRVVVLTGAGRGFCSGADTEVLAQLAAGTASLSDDESLSWDQLLGMRVPVVAAVNGVAAGLGTALLLMADVRFVAATARISTTFARLGLVAEYGSAWLLPRLIGHGAAMEVLLSGRTLDAQECHLLGLAQRVVPDEELLPTALAWAHEVATTCAPRSVALIKQQVLAAASQSSSEAFSSSIVMMNESFTRPELTEAVLARIERRAPVFADWSEG